MLDVTSRRDAPARCVAPPKAAFSSGEQAFQGNWLEAVMAPLGSGCPVDAPQYALFEAWDVSGSLFPRSVSSLPIPHHVLGNHQFFPLDKTFVFEYSKFTERTNLDEEPPCACEAKRPHDAKPVNTTDVSSCGRFSLLRMGSAAQTLRAEHA